MIKKTIILAAFLLTAYFIFVAIVIPQRQVKQHQWQGNKINAQNFIFNDSDTIKSVIVGSSLSARILTKELSGFYNLSFAGQSIFDGLNILSKKETIPKNVFIETNYLFRAEDPQFTASLFDSYPFYSQTYIPALRYGKEPLPMLISLLQDWKDKKENNKVENKTTISQPSVQHPLFDKLIAYQITNYSQKPDSLAMKNAMVNLKNYVDILRSKHVNVIFFEMPVNSHLCELPLSQVPRQAIHKLFPQNTFSYIDQPDCTNYNTSDGVHLTNLESEKYTAYFQDKIACKFCKN